MRKNVIRLAIAAIAISGSISSKGQIIRRVIGDTIAGYNGEGIPAAAAHLATPAAIAIDRKGNIYFGDVGNYRIRKVNTAGIITTVAGCGVRGNGGNGGPATAARIDEAVGLVTDKNGNLYFCDNRNLNIRKVDTFGIITLVAGADSGAAYMGYTGEGGPATAATFANPAWMAIDDTGNLYVTDNVVIGGDTDRVLKINTAGIISTFAGGGGATGDGVPALTAYLPGLSGISFDNTGNLIIATTDRIRKVNSSGIISTVAGPGPASPPTNYTGDGGPATDGVINGTQQLTVDKNGNIYFAEENAFRIRKISNAGIISTAAGTGVFGYSGDGGLATFAKIGGALGVACDRLGNLLFSDYDFNCIREVQYSVFVNPVAQPEQGMTLAPVPCHGDFTVNISSGTDEVAQITILSLGGQKVKELKGITNTAQHVHLDVPPGMYFVIASTSNGKWSRQLVVE